MEFFKSYATCTDFLQAGAAGERGKGGASAVPGMEVFPLSAGKGRGVRPRRGWARKRSGTHLLAIQDVEELLQRFVLDLSDPLAGEAEGLPDFLQGHGVFVTDPEPHL